MEGKCFIRRIKVQNLLSFDEEGIDLELEPLNVLIGANGSGKSNLIDVMGVLKAAITDLTLPFIMANGSVDDWINKSAPKAGELAQTYIELENQPSSSPPLGYSLQFRAIQHKPAINLETLVYVDKAHGDVPAEIVFLRRPESTMVRRTRLGGTGLDSNTQAVREEPSPPMLKTVLSKLRDPEVFPEIEVLREILDETAIYRDLEVGRGGALRNAQSAGFYAGRLIESAANIGQVVEEISLYTDLRERVLSGLREAYPRVLDVRAKTEGNAIGIYLIEEGLKEPLPLSRVSDGTLKYLLLLLILFHPRPPKVVCLEEPESGLHPDVVHKLADLLVEASQRMQLIVTTHSDGLVNALTDHVESVVVCEHDGKGTRMERLERQKLKGWLENYSLGELWSRGHIGGNRW